MIIFIILLLISCSSNFAQIKYDDYFLEKQLRLDYFHSGNNVEDSYSFDELIEEPFWGGSKINLIDTIGYGNFMFFVFDLKTDKLIYSRGYSTLFQEWQATGEAKKISRTFSETLVFPYPKDSVRVEIHDRNEKNKFQKRYEIIVDPNNYFVKKERHNEAEKFKVHFSGNSSNKLDIVFIPEGYSNSEMKKFHNDAERFAGYLFKYEPFTSYENSINIWGIDAYTTDSGVDIPADSVWKNTILNSTFYTFDSERYVMTTDNKSVRNFASNAPYDQIYILVNSKKYGGGAIYNHYSATVVDNNYSEKIFVHEFGHGLAGLADEYYTSDVSYQDFYDLEVEPWEPNITTLVDFDSKWKNLLDDNVTILTTINSKDELATGVFEGGGYVEKGVYRSSQNSIMMALNVDHFNEVSKAAILKIIRFYTE